MKEKISLKIKRLLILILVIVTTTFEAISQPEIKDQTHAEPKVITPGNGTSAPSDAIILFDGTSLSKWCNKINREAKWNVLVTEHGFVRNPCL